MKTDIHKITSSNLCTSDFSTFVYAIVKIQKTKNAHFSGLFSPGFGFANMVCI